MNGRTVYDKPMLFVAMVYGCVVNGSHIVYIEPELAGIPGGLIPCPFKDGVMELRHQIELEVAAGTNRALADPA